MAGHSHWAGIKHKKETVDAKRGKIFSKLLTAISAAATSEPNPDFNPRLRTAIQKAREENVPADTIDRAIRRASDPAGQLEELVFEAYGPGGVAIIIDALSDNRNRTVAEVKAIINEFGGKWAEAGSVLWAFERDPNTNAWKPKFTQSSDPAHAENLGELVAALEEHNDVQTVITNSL